MSDKDGSVYVFNVTGDAVSAFAPNGLTAGVIDNWSTGDNPFTPAQLAVALVEDPNQAPGNFVIEHDNRVIFKTASGELYNFSVEIPFVEGGDLILYVSKSDWTLYNTEGIVWATGDVRPGSAFGFTL